MANCRKIVGHSESLIDALPLWPSSLVRYCRYSEHRYLHPVVAPSEDSVSLFLNLKLFWPSSWSFVDFFHSCNPLSVFSSSFHVTMVKECSSWRVSTAAGIPDPLSRSWSPIFSSCCRSMLGTVGLRPVSWTTVCRKKHGPVPRSPRWRAEVCYSLVWKSLASYCSKSFTGAGWWSRNCFRRRGIFCWICLWSWKIAVACWLMVTINEYWFVPMMCLIGSCNY